MSSSHSSSTTSTQQPGQTVGASAQASAQPQKTVLISGEQGDSVNVQSQLATSHVAGDVKSKSNIGQVITDLSSAHSHGSQWLDAETSKVSQWGQTEIQRVLSQTKAMEEALIAGAKEKQKALDASHSGELAKLVQEMDLRKAAELKELEDGLQRQIQATLSASKQDINRVESEMNAKKMELLKQSQLKSAKEIDALSNLVVETKLVPSQTRTVIETNTNTGNVLAVATGGQIATGSAQAESYSSQKVAAIPNAGELRQAADVTRGDMIQDSTGRKVGEGAIINTMTQVNEQPNLRAGASGNDVTVNARPLQNDLASRPIAHREQPAAPVASTGLLSKDQLAQHAATHPVVDRSHEIAHANELAHGATQRPGEQIPMDKGREAGTGPMVASQHSNMIGAGHHDKMAHGDASDPAYNKHGDAHHHTGLMGKVKHALGLEHGHAGEPKSTDATKRV